MAKYKIIGGDRREYGPVSADELREWINDGRLDRQSSVRAEDGTDWKPLGTFPEFSDTLRLFVAPGTIGAAALKPSDWANRILAREAQLRLGECLRSGVSFLKANAAFVVLAVSITWVLKLTAFIPIIGGILHLLLGGVIMGGLYLACLRRLRGERVSVGAVFDGFRLCFVQLMLAGAISSLLTQLGLICCLLPGLFLLVAWVFVPVLVADKGLEFWSAMELSRKIVTRVWFQVFLLIVVVFLPFIVGWICILFKASALLVGSLREVDFDIVRWITGVSKRAAELSWTILLADLVMQLPLLICQFFAVGALMRAYENLFGARES
jgi:hypothetical protein